MNHKRTNSSVKPFRCPHTVILRNKNIFLNFQNIELTLTVALEILSHNIHIGIILYHLSNGRPLVSQFPYMFLDACVSLYIISGFSETDGHHLHG